MNVVDYDASALLAVVFDEPGSDSVMDYLARPGGGEVSAVNWSEVGAKLAERGLQGKELVHELAAFALDVVPFDEAQANVAATLRPGTHKCELSLSDRCCLALARRARGHSRCRLARTARFRCRISARTLNRFRTKCVWKCVWGKSSNSRFSRSPKVVGVECPAAFLGFIQHGPIPLCWENYTEHRGALSRHGFAAYTPALSMASYQTALTRKRHESYTPSLVL